MRFAFPYLLLALPFLLAGGWFFFGYARRLARRKLEKFGPASRLPNILRTVNYRAKKIKFILVLASLALLMVAASRPLLGPKPDAAGQTGAEFFIVLDISKSMLVRDVPPCRLDAIKTSLNDWLKTRHGDRIGLILMAGDSFVQAPLTNDYTALREVLAQSGPKSISLGGTNIPAAVKMAVYAMDKSGVKNKAVVIISDGENLEGQALPAIQDAYVNQKITFFTVGVGTAEGGPVPEKNLGPDFTGPIKDVIRDEYGVPAHSRLDERSLRSIAASGGGRYYSFDPAHPEETWNTLYNQSLKPLAHKRDSLNIKDYIDLFQIPLILAILALGYEIRISNRVKNPSRPASAITLPEPSSAPAAITMKQKKSAAKVATIIAVLFLLAPMGPANARAGTILTIEEAEALVKQGKPGEAAENLRAAAQKNPDDLYLMYNYGIASYVAGRFNEAIDAFSEVSMSNDEKLRSLASTQLGNAQYRLGQDLEKKSNLNGAVLAFERAKEYYEGANSARANKVSETNLQVTKGRLETDLLKVGNNLLTETWKKPYPAAKVPLLTEAFDAFDKAVKLNPNNSGSAKKLEETRKLLSQNLLTMAHDAREKAKAVDPAKDQNKEQEKQNTLASQTYQKARDIDPNNAALAAEHDAFKKEIGDTFADAAAKNIDEALKPAEANPNPAAVPNPEAELKKKQQLLNKALAPIEKALAFDENNAKALALKQTAQTNLEQIDLQLADIAKAKGEEQQKQNKPESAVPLYTDAQQNYQKALEINPDNQQAKDKLADVESKLASQLTAAGKNEMAAVNAPKKSPQAQGKAPNTDKMQQDIGHLEKAAATFAQADALAPGANDAQALQEAANQKLADLRGQLDKAQNENGQAGAPQPSNVQGDGNEPPAGEPTQDSKVAGNGPTKPTLSFSEARAPSAGEGLYRDLRQAKKIRDW